MSTTAEKNRKIAKNTLLLYFRMFASMIISLFTSREVLRILGVEDFGVYNIAGSVIGMFTFINAAMRGATSRFLTYELERKDHKDTLAKTFGCALLVHYIIAITIVILGETIGLWFILNKLVIPESSRTAAMVVYQLSIIGTAIGITQVPYNATLISNERMDLFAYFDIGNLLLKLLVLYLLFIIPFNKLIVYAILGFILSVGTMLFYRIITKRLFPEARSKLCFKPEILKPMLSFSGWDMYGNLSVTARTTGIQMLLNIFFGPGLNAAAGIAGSVQNTVMAFANNITTAIKPQIIKSYAAEEYGRTFSLICNGSNLIFALLLFLSLPIIVNINFVLKLWLTEVPPWTSQLAICTLIYNVFAGLSVVAVTGCHATGHIKRPSFINGTMYLCVVPITYIAFKWFDVSPILPFIFNFCAIAIGCLSNAFTCSMYIPNFSFKRYFLQVFSKCILVTLISSITVFAVSFFFEEDGWLRFFVLSTISCLISGVLGWYYLCTASIRAKILTFIKNKFSLK